MRSFCNFLSPMLLPTLLLLFALNLFTSNNCLSAYSNSDRVEQSTVDINATTDSDARSVNDSVNTTKSTSLLKKSNATDTDKADKDKSEERLPLSFTWIEKTPAALASASLRKSFTEIPLQKSTSTLSSESLPWSDSTHSTTSFSRSASTISSESLPWSDSTHSTASFSRSASTLSSESLPWSDSTHSRTTFSRSASTLSGAAYSRTSSTLSSDADDEMINDVVNQWIRDKETLHSVREYLHMDDMRASEYALSPNYKYYAKFASAQVRIWVQEDWSLDRVMSYLSLQYLPADKLKADPDFKYLTKFLDGQIAAWSIHDLSVDKVWKKLHLDRQGKSAKAIQDVTHDYYIEYLSGRLRAWFEDGEEVGDVMTRLGLDGLTGEALLDHRNYRAYKHFVKKKLKKWASVDEYHPDVVAEKLGLRDFRGNALTSHPNYPFLMKFRINNWKYFVEGMLKDETPTLDVWVKLKLNMVKTPTSFMYTIYENYVKAFDQYIMDRYKIDEIPEKFKSKFDAHELPVKTKIWVRNNTPDDYVKFSLGLKGLEGEELEAAPMYTYYDKYHDDMEWKKRYKQQLTCHSDKSVDSNGDPINCK